MNTGSAALAACSHLLPFIASTMSSVTFDPFWPADSVEFCPHPNAFSLFVCGTYKLEQNESSPAADEEPDEPVAVQRGSQVRRGKCMLFSVEEEQKLFV
jgi:hypothetical protein